MSKLSDKAEKARWVLIREYESHINLIADDLIERAEDGEFNTMDDLRDAISESADGDQYIIYYYLHPIAMMGTDNLDAYEDVMGEKAETFEAQLFFAMVQDINDALDRKDFDFDELYEEDE